MPTNDELTTTLMTEEVTLTESEACSLADFLENHLISVIRSDIDIENINYLVNLVHIYDKCLEVDEERREKQFDKWLTSEFT